MADTDQDPPAEDNREDKPGDASIRPASVSVSVWLDLTRAIAGCEFDHQHDSAAVLEHLISNALAAQVLEQYLTYLHWSFYPGENGHVRVVRLLIAIVEILRRDAHASISVIDGQLLDPDNPAFESRDDDNDGDDDDAVHRSRRETLIFMAIGWITNLFIPKLIPDGTFGTFAVDTEHATGYHTSHVTADLASRSVLENIRQFGDILPTRRRPERESDDDEADAMLGVSGGAGSSHILHIASMNISTLHNVGNIKIEWTSSLANHLDFDPAHLNEVTGDVTPILKLFRYPSLCYLFAPESSLLNKLLEHWYDEDEKPTRFTTKALMQEILLSYRLLIRFERKARMRYLRRLRPDVLGDRFDRELDTLCLWRRQWQFLECFQKAPFQIRETFHSSSDFPIFSARLVDIDRFINSIQPNRISSLWEDRRDMLRWYTFWAVIILGCISLVISLVQTALGATQVKLAQQSLGGSSQQSASSPQPS